MEILAARGAHDYKRFAFQAPEDRQGSMVIKMRIARSIRASTASAIGLSAMALAACAHATPPQQLHCAVEGAAQFQPAASEAALCDHFRRALGAVLGTTLKPVATAQAAGANSLSVRIAVNKKGILAAKIFEKRGGKAIPHGDVFVAVSDRAPALSSLDLLARGIAAELKKPTPPQKSAQKLPVKPTQ